MEGICSNIDQPIYEYYEEDHNIKKTKPPLEKFEPFTDIENFNNNVLESKFIPDHKLDENDNNSENNHRNEHPLETGFIQKPVDYYINLVNKYGEPQVIADVPGGICIWTRDQLRNTPFEEIVLRDEEVPHCVPANHIDFLYTYIRVYIPPEQINSVISISGSVNYDPLKTLLQGVDLKKQIMQLYTLA